MAALIVVLFLAVAVKQDQAPLQSACSADAETIAKLPAGADVTIRFVLSGESTACYKISTVVDGKEVAGYVAASALEGLDSFERGLRSAPALDFTQVMTAVRPVALAAAGGASSRQYAGVMDAAVALSDKGQPEKALELIEPPARNAKDPALLALAGALAWRADDARRALEYWRASLDLQPNPAIENLYKRVEKETSNDRSTERLVGVRVALRYEAGAVGVNTAREMVAALDQEYARVSGELGCSAQERIVAIAQSPEAYRKTTDAAEWSGGQFDGRIRVPVASGASAVDKTIRRTLAHEITHACLTLTGKWPAWLQEGLAQKLSGDVVNPVLRDKLADWAKDHKLPKLSALGQDWSRLDTEHAVAAYGLSLEAVDMFYETYGVDGVRNLLHNPDRLEGITAELDKRLGL